MATPNVGGTWTDVATGLQSSAGGDAWRLNSQAASKLTIESEVRLTANGASALILRVNVWNGTAAFQNLRVTSAQVRRAAGRVMVAPARHPCRG